MAEIFDIDDFLAKQEMTVVLKGKKFIVKDLDEETSKLMNAEEPDHRAIVKSILKCEDTDLVGYGIVAFTNIVQKVTKNLFPDASLSEVSND